MVGVDPLGGLGVDARRPLAGDPRQDVDVVGREVDRHADVADPGRERAGPARGDRVDGRQPALADEPAELEDGGIEPLDVADLDRARRAPAPRPRSPSPSSTVAASGFSTRTADAALDRREGEGHVGRRRGGDDDRVELRLRDHRQRLGESLGAGQGDRAVERLGDGIGDGGEADVRASGEDPEVVAAHRAEARQADAQRPITGRAPGCRHRAATPAFGAARGRPRAVRRRVARRRRT